ncbi:MFS transporter [Actinophytocola sp.]|uniref:MFS transporter n=1 Tax=Actinophytocola sp. TaxID=1872138 RepID=UPI003C7429C3
MFIASATATCADGIGKVSLPLLAASLTSSPVLVSGLTAFAFLPWLLFGLPGGALVDRLDRRRAMSTVNIMRAALLCTIVLVIVAGAGNLPVLYVAAFALGRVLGAHRVALWGGIPLGALIGGALADRTSVSAVFLVSGLAQLVVVVLIRRLINRHRQLIIDFFES